MQISPPFVDGTCVENSENKMKKHKLKNNLIFSVTL